MNRRSFLSDALKAGVAFTILPPATTYQRVWRVHREPRVRTIYEMLQECPHLTDPLPIDMDELFARIYALKRQRESQSGYDPNCITIERPISETKATDIPILVDERLKPGEWYFRPNPH